MFNKQSKLQTVIMLILGVMLLLACSFGGGSDDEAQALKDQVSALETQNAILKEEGASAPENPADAGEVQAPLPPSSDAAPEVAIASPTEESLPTGPVSAGTPIIYDGWSMMVRKEIGIEDYSDAFGISIVVRNLGDSDRVFRYVLAGVTISDDKGNTYQPTSDSLCEELMYVPKNLNVRSGNKEEIFTAIGFRNCHNDKGLQRFQGPIVLEAKQLLVHFEDFGPFSGVDVVIDL